jgi:guanylate kinase
MKKHTIIFIIGGSGTGKTTIAEELVKNHGYEKAITCTTRAPRVGEKNGVDYFFLESKSDLDKMYLNNELIESPSQFGDNWYGCPISSVYKDKPVVAVIEYQGLKKATELLSKDKNLTIIPVFLEALPANVVTERMRLRGSLEKEVQERLEIMKKESKWSDSNLYKMRIKQDQRLNKDESVDYIAKKINIFVANYSNNKRSANQRP